MGQVFVPADAAARSVGADEVAAALSDRVDSGSISLRRNGSRGLLWLEPLVEVSADDGIRYGFGPVTPSVVEELVAAGMVSDPAGVVHELALGPVDQIPELARQQRFCFARVGVIDPLDPADFEAHGGLSGLRAALAMPTSQVVEAVIASGLRGRGGAGFPAGIKWRTVAEAGGSREGSGDHSGDSSDDAPEDTSVRKYICCNADEGDSGTFADRMLMEGDPFTLLEGMAIAGYATGATRGFIYVRSEYPDAVRTLRRAIEVATAQGWLGDSVLGSGFRFEVSVRVGAGAYICGEETSMLNSLEGKRGEVRAKPPLPALEGLFGAPTVVNNVLTLASVPAVLSGGAAAYADAGVGRSRGTQVFQLAGNIARGGIVEVPFGVTVRELVEDFGGGTASGRPIGAVQVGGPLGSYLGPEQLDLPMDYEALAAAGAMLGHGGVVVFDDTVDPLAQARFAMEFCAAESCGKCTPCRVGSVRGVEVIDRIAANEDREKNLLVLDDLCELMADGSLCAMGGLTPMPVRSAMAMWHARSPR